MGTPPGLIRSKTRPPALGPGVIERPRVLRALRGAAEGRGILLVVAPPGSGKTVAAAQLLAGLPGPRAWLALGASDVTPGRVVTYLAAAVGAIDPAAAERVHGFLADGLGAEDCAAILGEGLPPGSAVVVDDLHHVESRAPVLRALRAFLDAAPRDALVVLLSRRLVHLDLSREVLEGRVGAVAEEDLAFRADEIAALLAARGLPGDAERIAAGSGGWAAGIVFDALRGGRAPAAGPPPEDPFFSYLGSEVLDALPAALRDVVLRSALLETVSPSGLAAVLGVPSAQDLFDEICRHHLPGSVDGDGLRYHPRFREFLLDRLRREGPGDVAELMARCARALLAEGHAEEAADGLIAAGAPAEAAPVVESAAPALMRRGDWDKVLAWCGALGDPALAARPALRGIQVRSLLMSRRQDDVEALVARMRASGELDRLATEAPDVAAWAVWALHVGGDWAAMLGLLPDPAASRRARVARYILETAVAEDPPPAWTDEELDRFWPLHVALESALYYRGAFAEVERLAWAAAGRGPVTATLAEIYRVAVLRQRGDLADARAVLDAAARRVRSSRFIEFWQQVEAELLFDEGEREAGLRMMREARRTSREHGYRVADRAVLAVGEGRMLVRMGRLPEAMELLGAARAWCAERGLRCFGEWAAVWLAAAQLGLGGDPAEARELLRGAIAGMERADRRLELPRAYVLLAEAEWRAGDEAAHDAAADAAHAAAVRMGTLGPLLAALRDAPGVLVRRIDASPAGDPTWRELDRAGRAAGAARRRWRARGSWCARWGRRGRRTTTATWSSRRRRRPSWPPRWPGPVRRARRGPRSPPTCSRAARTGPTTCASSCTACGAPCRRVSRSRPRRGGSPGCRRGRWCPRTRRSKRPSTGRGARWATRGCGRSRSRCAWPAAAPSCPT
ncbi:AAA family ATPase [Miltoncostaea marina]|uniref:AAA family ATPase n=1 Tax=Miltoncostaea marina TaxID=2843215 RepID=UPI001C3C9AE8|nr:AAA family ATPase [Miltoncostaea marina]